METFGVDDLKTLATHFEDLTVMEDFDLTEALHGQLEAGPLAPTQ